MQITFRLVITILFLSGSAGVYSQVAISVDDKTKQIATLRQGVELNIESENPARLEHASNKDIKRERAYPMQPPTIPHKIDGYQIDLSANKCLSCHARTKTQQSQAPMVSVTHFMDRDGNFLADVSPRRYFCTQCHVTQIERAPLVSNTFIAIEEIIIKEKNKKE